MHEAIQAWAQRGDREVLLPSGQRVKIRLRSAVELLREGTLPDALRRRAMEYETGGLDAKALSPDEKMSAYEFMRAFVARSISAVSIEDEAGEVRYHSVRLGPDELAELPEDDVSEVQAIVTLRKSPLQVTAESEVKLGRRSATDAELIAGEEAGGTVDGWVPFRDGSGGDPAGPAGRAVREVAGAGLPGDR
jgi:hypothetical protein